MPRFRLEAAFDLVPVLRRLGVQEAFCDSADFTAITDREPLRISAIAHKAYIDVDEQGTEAAAATAAVFTPLAAVRRPPPVTMVVDRPFLFAIIETATGIPVFLGQVSRPHSP
jgi:serpin B